jgi:hypothetical protein
MRVGETLRRCAWGRQMVPKAVAVGTIGGDHVAAHLYASCWLEKPDGSGKLTDPVDLGAVFGRAGHLPTEARG